jgi:hypothetical protein
MIYNASKDGWGANNFHDKCDNKKRWTIIIVYTTKGFIFGGFTTAKWENSSRPIYKRDHHSFLFSVNLGCKYPITGGDRTAIECKSGFCAVFGTDGNELRISNNANNNNDSFCLANGISFKLPVA